jgi:cell division protein FtsN
MKKYTVLVLLLVASLSCNRNQVPQKTAEELNSVPVRAEGSDYEEDIVEKEERLVQVDQEPVSPERYYVIIGSFRNKDNATQYQSDIREKGFSSRLLKNDEGLYRVSVMSTDDINKARNEIRYIRSGHPEHADTWLLISKR